MRIERALPGEYKGTVNPEDYGFEVIRDEPPTKEEEARLVGRLYAETKERTGVVIPSLEPYLDVTLPEQSVGAGHSGDPSAEGGPAR